MTRHDDIRRLLIHYHDALALGQQLALKLLDVVQADAGPVSPETARECRRFVGEALARIESNETEATRLWNALGVERRVTPGEGPPSPAGAHDRRRSRRHTT